MGMRIDDVVKMYIDLRDQREAIDNEAKAKMAEIDVKMAKLDGALLQTLDGAGLKSVNTEFGTAFIDTKTSATIADRSIFLDHCRTKEEWGLMTITPNKKAVREHKDQHDGMLPPGINWREERTIKVRRS